ncbi:MAG: hypothetical protein AAFP84_02490 [Actinomycetota bacterium]
MTDLLDATSSTATTPGDVPPSPFAAPTGAPVALAADVPAPIAPVPAAPVPQPAPAPAIALADPATPFTPVTAPIADVHAAGAPIVAGEAAVTSTPTPEPAPAIPAVEAAVAATPTPEPAPAIPAVEAPAVPAMSLPSHQPRQDQNRPLPGTLPIDLEALQAPPKRRRQPMAAVRRLIKTVIWLAVLGGLGYAGYVYGPELYERYVGDGEPEASATPSIADEPPAPLAFPAATFAPSVAAATIQVVGTGPDGVVEYEVTTDFTSAVSQTLIRRGDAADLEVIALGDEALIRRTDDTTWYRTTRGSFPLDGQLAREDWVRFVDELFPTEVRGEATIDGATLSAVAGTPTRHLVVSVPRQRIAPPPSIPSLRDQLSEPVDPTVDDPTLGDPALAPVTDPAATPVPVESAPPAATEPTPTDAADPAVPAAPVTDSTAPATDPVAPTSDAPPTPAAPAAPTVEMATVEVWIDDAGVVRQAIGADVFGVDRLTVTQTMPEPWAPILPAPESIRPLDAEAVVLLGL